LHTRKQNTSCLRDPEQWFSIIAMVAPQRSCPPALAATAARINAKTEAKHTVVLIKRVLCAAEAIA
jgi:hypothetical protein